MMEQKSLTESIEPFDIYIVGTGIIPAYHLTREAEAAIKRSKELLYIDNSFGSDEFLRTLCPNTTNLHSVTYKEGEERIDAYRKMAALVIEAALDHPPVTIAFYGHPLIYCFPPFLVLATAKMLGLKVKVMPGISSLDTLFIDLKIDPCTFGIQMYEATDLLLRKRPIQADVPCLIWQIGTIESRLYSEANSKPERFKKIKDYLLQFYPPEALMIAVCSANMPLAPSTLTEFTLDSMEEKAEELHQGLTVYIPPIKIREVQDQELVQKMDDTSHLQEFTCKM